MQLLTDVIKDKIQEKLTEIKLRYADPEEEEAKLDEVAAEAVKDEV